MWLIKLAWKNLWRNRTRTAVTISSVFFAVVLAVATSSLQDGVFDNFVKNMVSFYSGYIQVHKYGYWDQQILDNSLARTEALEKLVNGDAQVLASAPRLESYALASTDLLTHGCMVVGIAPREENEITFLQDKITEGEYLNDAESGDHVLLSEGLANRLNLHLHDTIILISQGYHGSMAAGKYWIQGIVRFGSPDLNNQLLYMPLVVAQEFYNAQNLVTSYVLALKSSADLQKTSQAIAASLGSEYEVMTWEEMMPEVDQHIKTDRGSMVVIQGILYLLICFGIFGTLLMMMAERKYEMGMLIAIGMKKSKLIAVLTIESVLNVIIGCALGILFSIPVVLYLKYYPIRFTGEMAEFYEKYGFEAIFPASMNPTIFVNQAIIVLVLGLMLSLYPLVKIIQLNPVTAMKK
jgi:putative ABC transport system permease protein